MVFTDTPGFHKPKTLLGTRLNKLVRDAVEGVDAVVLVVDAQAGVGRGDAYVYERQVAPVGGFKVCVVNKVDAIRHHLIAAARGGPGARNVRRDRADVGP